MSRLGFPKAERLCGRKAAGTLFEKGRRISRPPLQLVYHFTEHAEPMLPEIRVLVTVSKRNFRLAHDRNRIKRQIREAWRLTRFLLMEKKSTETAPALQKALHIALIYQSGKKEPFFVIREALENMLRTLAGKL
jgi:ribonuclease P protein component